MIKYKYSNTSTGMLLSDRPNVHDPNPQYHIYAHTQVLQQPLDNAAFEKQVCDDLDPENTTARDHTNFLMVTNLSPQFIIYHHHNQYHTI